MLGINCMSVLGWGKTKGKPFGVEDRNSEAEKSSCGPEPRKGFCAVSLKIKKRKNQDKN